MTILINLINSISWKTLNSGKMPYIRILSSCIYAECKENQTKEIEYFSQFNRLKLKTVLPVREIRRVCVSKCPALCPPEVQQSSLENWNTQPENLN